MPILAMASAALDLVLFWVESGLIAPVIAFRLMALRRTLAIGLSPVY